MGMCILHLTCESSCRGRYRGPWISPALLEMVDPWSEILASNLATAAALCRSFLLGLERGRWDESRNPDEITPWRPGINLRSAQ